MSALRATAATVLILLAVDPATAQDAVRDERPGGPPMASPFAPVPPDPSVAEEKETLPTRVAEVPGTWDLSKDGTSRRCVMTLLKDKGPAGQLVNFPAGCRRALPVMNGVAGWLYADEAVRLVDKDIRPVLQFKRRQDRRSYVGTAPGGETYSLVPLDTAGMRPPEPEPAIAAAVPAPSPAVATAATVSPGEPGGPVVPAPPLPPLSPDGPQPGTYALDRLRQQVTCRLAFERDGTVKLLAGCHDDGIEVFNPVTWRYDGGRLTVTAKRGHSIGLVKMDDGRWRRDPETGVVFILRRIEG